MKRFLRRTLVVMVLFALVGLGVLPSRAQTPTAQERSPGALDMTFNPGSGTDGEVAAIAMQPADGRCLSAAISTP